MTAYIPYIPFVSAMTTLVSAWLLLYYTLFHDSLCPGFLLIQSPVNRLQVLLNMIGKIRYKQAPQL